jgi:lipoprotein-releasing system permease protein
MNGFEQELKTRILGTVPHAIISNENHLLSNWQQQIPELLKIDRVKSVEPVVRGEAIAQTASALQGVLFEGVEPENFAGEVLKSNINIGRLSDLTAGSYHIIIGRSLAHQLGVTVGDKVRIISARGSRFTPLGRIPSQRNFTIAGLFDVGADVDNHLVLMHLQDAAHLIHIGNNQITGLRLYFEDPFDIQSWQAPVLLAGQSITDWRQTHGELFAAVKMEKNMIWLLLCLVISVAAFNILSSSVMVVSDKNSEVAILKTLGISDVTLNLIFIIQGAWSGIIGALIGTGLGLLVSSYINEIISFLGVHFLSGSSGGERLLPVVFQPVQIIVIMFAAMLLSLMATLYPAYRAGKVSPVEALRYE